MKRYPPGLSAEQGQPVTHTHHEFGPARDRSELLLATLGYLGAIFFTFLPALGIFTVKRRSSSYLRYHAAQAFNVSITIILFSLSAFIVGAMLALDTVVLALSVALPLLTLVWLIALFYLIRGALATARDQPCEFPQWLCVQALNPLQH
jgi:uncharacterized Tic20 family protein